MADLNPDSLEVLTRLPGGAGAGLGARSARRCSSSGRVISAPIRTAQPDRLVFNRTVGLRDTWAKVQAKA